MEDNSKDGRIPTTKEKLTTPFQKIGGLKTIIQKALWNGSEERSIERTVLLITTNSTFSQSTQAVSTPSPHRLSSDRIILTYKALIMCVIYMCYFEV